MQTNQQPPSVAPIAPPPPQQTDIITLAKERLDLVVLMLTLMFLGGLFLLSGLILDLSLVIIVTIILGGILFYIRLFQIGFLGNALRVQTGRHQHLLDMVNEISTNLAMPQVDVFITQDPYL